METKERLNLLAASYTDKFTMRLKNKTAPLPYAWLIPNPT